MHNGLEKFIRANRKAFDTEEPSDEVWKNLEKHFGGEEQKKTFVYRSLFIKTASVAATVLLVSLSIWYVVSPKNTQPVVAKINTVDSPALKTPAQIPQAITETPLAKNQAPEDSSPAAAEDEYHQEIYYYAKLSEIKFNQLKRIEKDEPALYKSFAGEIQKLDSTYHNLQAMLTGNVDKEAVLGAMLANLKMQTEILTKQLNIIHTIKQSKKSKYENNYPTI